MTRGRAFALLSILLLGSGLSLVAQARAGTGNLRRLTAADFLFLGLQDPALYAESSLTGNPANLMRLTNLLLTNRTTMDLTRSSTTLERVDATVGALGGTFTTAETSLFPTESLGVYVPVGAGRTPSRLGIRVEADFDMRRKLDTYKNYRSFSELLTVKETDWPISAAFDLALGVPTRTQSLGFSLGYGFGYLPAVFPVREDATLNPVLVSYEVAVRQNDTFTHRARAQAGTILSLSRAAELSLALAYTGTLQDAARSWIAIDTDADGRAETMMLYSDWVVTTTGVDKGGPAKAATTYSQMDITVGNEVVLSPLLRLYVSDTAELFLGGRYFGLLRSDRLQYRRPKYPGDIIENLSQFRQHLDGSFKSFDATLGVGLATARDAYLKVGVTYTRRDQTLTQDGVLENGTDSLYSSRNPDNYTELALGLEPVNDSIRLLLDRPTLSVAQSVAVLLGWSYVPAAGLGLFVGGTVRGAIGTDTYRAYNLDTRSVWEETVPTQGIVWAFNPVAGLRLRVSDTLSVGMSAEGTGIGGSLVSNDETAPDNLELGKITLNGAQDLESTLPFRVSVELDVTVVL